MLDNLLAGHETSGITLAYLMYEHSAIFHQPRVGVVTGVVHDQRW